LGGADPAPVRVYGARHTLTQRASPGCTSDGGRSFPPRRS
jgi:hypothetical protein